VLRLPNPPPCGRSAAVGLVLAVASCGSPLPSSPFGGGAGPASASAEAGGAPELELWPTSAPSEIAAIVRVSVRFAASVAPSEVLFVEGTVSSAQLHDIAKGTIAKTVAARTKPALAWIEPGAHVVSVRPLEVLAPGGVYTLVVSVPATALTLRVTDSDPVPQLGRVWPLRADAEASGRFAVYCGSGELGPIDREGAFEPDLGPGRWSRGVGASFEVKRCVRWAAGGTGPSARAVAPAFIRFDDGSEARIDPSPIEGEATAPLPDVLPCAESELEAGPACAEPLDDRLIVRPPQAPLLFAFEGQAPVVSLGAPFVVRRKVGPTELRGAVVDRLGSASSIDIALPDLAPAPHFVINEVYADALGPEPAQEWVEIVNDGPVGGSLGGYRLSVGAGVTLLPDAWLDAGSFALVVRSEFVLDDGVDPVPELSAVIVRVASIGRSGLPNDGDALALSDPSGRAVSRFPAKRARPGVSIVRRSPEVFDDDPASFALSPEAGATPGAPNLLSGE
jgi:hypothetical protein